MAFVEACSQVQHEPTLLSPTQGSAPANASASAPIQALELLALSQPHAQAVEPARNVSIRVQNICKVSAALWAPVHCYVTAPPNTHVSATVMQAYLEIEVVFCCRNVCSSLQCKTMSGAMTLVFGAHIRFSFSNEHLLCRVMRECHPAT